MANKESRGFGSMDPKKQREIASKGGKAAHQKGTAHEFTSEEAKVAGRKGGRAAHQKRTAQAAATRGFTTPTDVGSETSGAPSSTSNNLFSLLESDHENVDTLLGKLSNTGMSREGFTSGNENISDLFHQLCLELEVHAKGEESTVYPRLGEKPGCEELAKRATAEHTQIHQLLDQMGGLRIQGSSEIGNEWSSQVTKLKQLVEAHVALEEDEIFAKLRESFDDKQLEQIAMAFTHAKEAARPIFERSAAA